MRFRSRVAPPSSTSERQYDHIFWYHQYRISPTSCRPYVANEPRAVSAQRRVGSIRVLAGAAVDVPVRMIFLSPNAATSSSWPPSAAT
jgi:hypothetical protein